METLGNTIKNATSLNEQDIGKLRQLSEAQSFPEIYRAGMRVLFSSPLKYVQMVRAYEVGMFDVQTGATVREINQEIDTRVESLSDIDQRKLSRQTLATTLLTSSGMALSVIGIVGPLITWDLISFGVNAGLIAAGELGFNLATATALSAGERKRRHAERPSTEDLQSHEEILLDMRNGFGISIGNYVWIAHNNRRIAEIDAEFALLDDDDMTGQIGIDLQTEKKSLQNDNATWSAGPLERLRLIDALGEDAKDMYGGDNVNGNFHDHMNTLGTHLYNLKLAIATRNNLGIAGGISTIREMLREINDFGFSIDPENIIIAWLGADLYEYRKTIVPDNF